MAAAPRARSRVSRAVGGRFRGPRGAGPTSARRPSALGWRGTAGIAFLNLEPLEKGEADVLHRLSRESRYPEAPGSRPRDLHPCGPRARGRLPFQPRPRLRGHPTRLRRRGAGRPARGVHAALRGGREPSRDRATGAGADGPRRGQRRGDGPAARREAGRAHGPSDRRGHDRSHDRPVPACRGAGTTGQRRGAPGRDARTTRPRRQRRRGDRTAC